MLLVDPILGPQRRRMRRTANEVSLGGEIGVVPKKIWAKKMYLLKSKKIAHVLALLRVGNQFSFI